MPISCLSKGSTCLLTHLAPLVGYLSLLRALVSVWFKILYISFAMRHILTDAGCPARKCCRPHNSRASQRSSSQHLNPSGTAQATCSFFRHVLCNARVSLKEAEGDKSAPSLSSLNKLDLSSAVILANLLKPPQEQYYGPSKNDDPDEDIFTPDGTERPNDPATVSDFVQALDIIVRSSNNDVNPDQMSDVIQELLQRDLIKTFTPKQLGITLKNLSVICELVPFPLISALVRETGRQVSAFDIPQLSNVAWALMRIMPVADEESRELVGMDQHWLEQYCAVSQQQLQQVTQEQLPVPAAQQLANLLLIPAAVEQPMSSEWQQLFEQAVVMGKRRLCGTAVAQIFTCYTGLNSRPGQELLNVLLQHLEEEYLLYDYDELTQVAVAVYQLQLRLPNRLLADITERCDMLEASKQAAAGDVELMRECLSRLAKAAVAAA